MTQQLEDEILKILEGQDLAKHIALILDGIRFGSIEIIIHDGRVVQIERHQKFRIQS